MTRQGAEMRLGRRDSTIMLMADSQCVARVAAFGIYYNVDLMQDGFPSNTLRLAFSIGRVCPLCTNNAVAHISHPPRVAGPRASACSPCHLQCA